MWNKIFLTTLAIFATILAFFMYYAWSWLRSIGNPADAYQGFEFWSALGWAGLWIATLILLLNANLVFAKTERPWAFWATFGFFAFFITVKFFWLGAAAVDFQRAHQIDPGSAILGPFLAVFICIGFAGVVFANHYVAERSRLKIYPPEPTFEDPDNDVIEK
ncbi:MAG: hypothetical protein H0V76_12625 [Blastocatellia bacterium]|nr:hypothetical protein [Blastocatellia bacterium]